MKKMLLFLGLVATLGLTTEAHAEPSTPAARWASCRYQSANPNVSWSRWEVRATIRCAADKWPVDIKTAYYVANRESRYQARAYNAEGACGIYQFVPHWHPLLPDLAKLHGVVGAPDCRNARTNVLAAIKVAHNHGWGPWSI